MKLLIVEDDTTFASVLSKSMSRRGFTVYTAQNIEDARKLSSEQKLNFAILDLKLEHGSSLLFIPELKTDQPNIKILVLTGYSSIATAVEAIKLGADNYLPKPASASEIIAALQPAKVQEHSPENPDTTFKPLSVKRLEWEHIQKTLEANNGNISETARQLNMHRRTLQRKLLKKPVKD